MVNTQLAMTKAALDAIKEPAYNVPIPWLNTVGWKGLLASVDIVREGYYVKGKGSIQYAFMQAFIEVCGGLRDGCTPGLYGSLETSLLRENVFREIFSKPNHPGVESIVEGDKPVMRAIYIYVGGLWEETQSLYRITSWIRELFIPLIRVAMVAYNAGCKHAQDSHVSTPGDNRQSAELVVLGRLSTLISAKRAKQTSKPAETVTSLSFPFAPPPTEVVRQVRDSSSKLKNAKQSKKRSKRAETVTDTMPTSSTYAPPSTNGPSQAQDASTASSLPGHKFESSSARPADLAGGDDPFLGVSDLRLMDAFSPKRKRQDSEEEFLTINPLLLMDTSGLVTQARSPLTPRNLRSLDFPRPPLFSATSPAGWGGLLSVRLDKTMAAGR
ncbi:hypothetical protein DFH09DRAFT_1127060 [Mycena vulgaris]|nr:hypothetical protein DFH09DRAFT_1127060 [Mycena vulgaris]